MKIHISKGNAKIGNAWNISLPPVTTCRANAPCARDCYALKVYAGYAKTSAGKAWKENLEIYQANPFDYFGRIVSALQRGKPDFFRWHIGGDIPDAGYFIAMMDIADRFRSTRFLVFTKRYFFVAGYTPHANLSIVLSAWPGLDIYNPSGFPIAYMQDGTETRISEGDLHCPGLCASCGACWDLAKTGRNVWFSKH